VFGTLETFLDLFFHFFTEELLSLMHILFGWCCIPQRNLSCMKISKVIWDQSDGSGAGLKGEVFEK
jgi:hypothetical protein